MTGEAKKKGGEAQAKIDDGKNERKLCQGSLRKDGGVIERQVQRSQMQDDESRCSMKAGMLEFFHSSLRTSVFNLFSPSSGAIKRHRWLVPHRTLLRGKKAGALHEAWGPSRAKPSSTERGLGFNRLRVQLGLSAASGRSYASSQNSHITPQRLGLGVYSRQILFTAPSRGSTDKRSKTRGRRDGELSSG